MGASLPAAHQEIADREIKFFIYIPGFPGGDLKHERVISDPVTPGRQIGPIEDVNARILLVDRGQILGLEQLARIVVDSLSVPVIQTRLKAGDREERVFAGKIRIKGLDGARYRFGAEQRIRAVRLQIEIGRDLDGIVEQDLIHGYIIGPQMRGAIEEANRWKMFPQPGHDGLGVRIHHDLLDLRDGQQGLEDVMKEGLSGQEAVILAGDALAVMAHGDEGNDLR
jgi:hypothetical protein